MATKPIYPLPYYQAPNDQNPRIVFGTGGETVGGALYVTDLKSVIKEDLSQAILLDQSNDKGYIGPPAVVDLNHDGQLDIVANAVNGRLLAFDGQHYQTIMGSSYSKYGKL